MNEEDKKLHIFTSLNTKINRDNTNDSDYYVNECKCLFKKVYKKLYGKDYKYPPKTRKRTSKEKRKVTFAEEPIIMNKNEFLD
jgi:hypothetical protein